MKIMKLMLLNICLLCVFISNASAEEKAMIVKVDEQGKAHFSLATLPVSELDLVLGGSGKPSNNATTLILEAGKKAVWTTESLTEINTRYGGEGAPEIKLAFDKPKAIEIFDRTAILPKSGKWKPSITSRKSNGCPAKIQASLMSQVMKTDILNIVFKKPFNPADMHEGFKKMTWVKKSENVWETQLIPNELNKSPAGMSFDVSWTIEPTSSEKIVSKARINVKVSKMLSAALGGNTECDVRVNGLYEYKGE